MKKILLAALLAASTPASAEHWDVITFEMTGKCAFDKYLAIVADFNVWGATYGYRANVAAPLQSENLTTYFWVGETANAAAFGATWDAWRNELSDAKSTPAKLWARFQECSSNLQRNGYDVY